MWLLWQKSEWALVLGWGQGTEKGQQIFAFCLPGAFLCSLLKRLLGGDRRVTSLVVRRLIILEELSVGNKEDKDAHGSALFTWACRWGSAVTWCSAIALIPAPAPGPHLGCSPYGVLTNTPTSLPGWVLWVLSVHAGHLTFRQVPWHLGVLSTVPRSQMRPHLR